MIFSFNINDGNYIGKLPCKTHAWNSLYTDLPAVFDEKDLSILIKFYYEIEKLLDDRNWLEFNESNEIGAIKGSTYNIRVLTEFDMDKIKENKIMISKILNNILELKEELNFIKKY